MKQLIMVSLVLAAVFGSTFLIVSLSGVVTLDDIETLLTQAKSINVAYVSVCVMILLLADLVMFVPTMSICLLAGFLLGFPLGFFSALMGMLMSGILGYVISRKYGRALLVKIYKDPEKLAEMENIFNEKGAVVILLSRAAPMLPEISCCLAGANNMPFKYFISVFLMATAPYALITTIAGSYSSVENPMPAVYAAISITLILWVTWYVFLQKNRKNSASYR